MKTELTKPILNDEERELVKSDPTQVASELAWKTSSDIIEMIRRNDGIPNGRLIAIEVDKAIKEATS